MRFHIKSSIHPHYAYYSCTMPTTPLLCPFKTTAIITQHSTHKSKLKIYTTELSFSSKKAALEVKTEKCVYHTSKNQNHSQTAHSFYQLYCLHSKVKTKNFSSLPTLKNSLLHKLQITFLASVALTLRNFHTMLLLEVIFY